MLDNPNTAEAPKPRRWFQFRLLMLLLAVVLGALFFQVGERAVRVWENEREKARHTPVIDHLTHPAGPTLQDSRRAE